MDEDMTVREALYGVFIDRHNDNRLRAIGIDPDMSVEELKHRLLIAKRVLRWMDVAGDDLDAETLAWLTREEA